MKPALSVIFFTVSSGAGCGLLFWLGLLIPLRLLPAGPFAAVTTVLALVLTVSGLLSSVFHLGRPERAWRALSQWRSSWLSREGVAAFVTIVPGSLAALLYALDWPGLAMSLGLLAAIGAVATVYCTGMIYASLKPVREWHHPLVTPGYLLLAAYLGAVVLALMSGGAPVPVVLALLLGLAGLALKNAYWRSIDAAVATSTMESATGLGFIGRVRALEAPHTETNYLLREMGFRVARTHAAQLRRIALLGAFVLPMLLLVLAALAGGALGVMLAGLAAILAPVGMLAERWLMFAQATHTVTLYYGGPKPA